MKPSATSPNSLTAIFFRQGLPVLSFNDYHLFKGWITRLLFLTLSIFAFLICDAKHIALNSCTETTTMGNNWYVSPSGSNHLNNSNGLSPTMPLKTISYAVNNAWAAGDTIFVMNGTYQNNNYGSGNLNNNPVVYLSGTPTGQADGWLIIRNYPGHQPKLKFDGAGGFVGANQAYLEISGFEIEGPNQEINGADALNNRLIQDNYFSGRGIAIWSGHHIYIHDNIIHDCPNSGIRVNNGDYCTIDRNEVYNNTWWSSNAESAIVFATAQDIDTESIIKMRITNNLVYDNYNNIPYYNSTYTGETSDYGTVDQDYIIDGSGCYITRNRDTYLHGWFYFANNISYGNGINGLVVHKSDRTIVLNNTCFMNGAVPLSAGRQLSSGITIHGSDDVQMHNNISWARYDEDYGYKVYDWDNTQNLQASNNILAKGLSDFTAAQYTFTDPLFMDAPNRDFRLQGTSPAIDGGIVHPDLPPFDYENNPRNAAAAPDIGAFEFIDSDADGTPDYLDNCPSDPNKINPEICGCGVLETACQPHIVADEGCITIHPNFTENTVEINGLLGNYTIEILNEDGTLFQSLTTSDSSIVIDISALPAGCYFIAIEHNTNSAISVEKMLKI